MLTICTCKKKLPVPEQKHPPGNSQALSSEPVKFTGRLYSDPALLRDNITALQYKHQEFQTSGIITKEK